MAATADVTHQRPRYRKQRWVGGMMSITAVDPGSGAPNAVARAHANPLRDRPVLLELLCERLLDLEGLVGRLRRRRATTEAHVRERVAIAAARVEIKTPRKLQKGRSWRLEESEPPPNKYVG